MNVFQQIKLYWDLRPYVERFRELASMKLTTNVVGQILALILQALNQFGGLFPEQHKAKVALAIGLLQLVIGYLAHYSNTNGTPQEVPGGKAAEPPEKPKTMVAGA